MGVRRVGKTSLCQSIEGIEYFDCELPRVRQLFADPEEFLSGYRGKKIALDEIHRLDNPSELLKIAADHYPEVKIIATGSSTLGASAKFRDTLTGRKRSIWLTPLLLEEMTLFGTENIRHRFLCGGFPSFFEQTTFPEKDFQEWLEAYWAKDIEDMFTVGKRSSFLKFAELLLVQSGGQFEASKFTIPCEVSRTTISNYLAILEETFIVHVIRPYSTHKATEIVMAPKVYGLDTGFVCHAKGWQEVRPEDCGLLWKQCVLNELHGVLQRRSHTINYWRDKSGHEVDFIIARQAHHNVTAIECKFKCIDQHTGSVAAAQLSKNLEVFRRHYPSGTNFIVAHDVNTPFARSHNGLTLNFVNPQQLTQELLKS